MERTFFIIKPDALSVDLQDKFFHVSNAGDFKSEI